MRTFTSIPPAPLYTQGAVPPFVPVTGPVKADPIAVLTADAVGHPLVLGAPELEVVWLDPEVVVVWLAPGGGAEPELPQAARPSTATMVTPTALTRINVFPLAE